MNPARAFGPALVSGYLRDQNFRIQAVNASTLLSAFNLASTEVHRLLGNALNFNFSFSSIASLTIVSILS